MSSLTGARAPTPFKMPSNTAILGAVIHNGTANANASRSADGALGTLRHPRRAKNGTSAGAMTVSVGTMHHMVAIDDEPMCARTVLEAMAPQTTTVPTSIDHSTALLAHGVGRIFTVIGSNACVNTRVKRAMTTNVATLAPPARATRENGCATKRCGASRALAASVAASIALNAANIQHAADALATNGIVTMSLTVCSTRSRTESGTTVCRGETKSPMKTLCKSADNAISGATTNVALAFALGASCTTMPYPGIVYHDTGGFMRTS